MGNKNIVMSLGDFLLTCMRISASGCLFDSEDEAFYRRRDLLDTFMQRLGFETERWGDNKRYYIADTEQHAVVTDLYNTLYRSVLKLKVYDPDKKKRD